MIKKKSINIKYEMEYDSPDGEKYDISLIKCDDPENNTRCYIQWSVRPPEGSDKVSEKIIIDGDMLAGIYECYQEIIGSKKKSEKGLYAPKIVDHRSKTPPMESFNATAQEAFKNTDSATKFHSGVDHENQDEVEDTPKEWQTDTTDEQWKIDVENRKHGGVKKDPDKVIKKVGAKDVL